MPGCPLSIAPQDADESAGEVMMDLKRPKNSNAMCESVAKGLNWQHDSELSQSISEQALHGRTSS